MSDTYIGCKAQISTKSKFKYEGTISAINPLEMTICLAAVHIIEGPGKVDPHKEYTSVTFKSGDVMDLQVFEGEQSAPEEEKELVDPAILAFEEEDKKKDQDWLDPQFYNGPPKIGPYSNLPNSYINEHPEANPRHSSPRKSPRKSAPAATAAALIEEEFDYSASTSRFDKQKQAPGGLSTTASNPAGSIYDKKLSFFDNLMLEREDGGNRRDQIQQEKNRNLETFGVAMGPTPGGGRTGRGGYRGRGRGRGRNYQK
jgi:hypothetical protein